MNPESLQTLGVFAIALGFMLMGLGGFAVFTTSQKLQHSAEIKALQQKNEMDAQVLTLLLKNQELQRQAEQANPPPAPGPAYRPPAPPPPVFQSPSTHSTSSGPSAFRPVEPPAPTPPRVSLERTPEEAAAAAVEVDAASEVHLTLSQRRTISDTLRAHGRHTVTIESSFGDTVSRDFAEQLGEAFAQADWKVRGIDPHRGLPLSSGVTVSAGSFPPQPETRAVYEALLSAGIPVTQQLDPRQRNEETVLLVGAPL